MKICPAALHIPLIPMLSQHRHFIASIPLGLFATIAPLLAQDWELRSETVYSTGNYGTGIRTEVLYAPLEIRRIFDWGELGLAVPYLWYRTEGNFVFVDGTTNPTLRTIPISGGSEGLSDLLIDAKLNIVSQSGNRPEILLRAYWKPPTADEARGLGTGSHDWIVGTEFWSWLPESERWFYFGDLFGYFPGGAEARNLRDSWIYDIGLGGLVTPDLIAKLSYREQFSISPGQPSARLLEFETEYKLNANLRILSGFSLGMSDASPDWSAMIGFEQSF